MGEDCMVTVGTEVDFFFWAYLRTFRPGVLVFAPAWVWAPCFSWLRLRAVLLPRPAAAA